MDQTLSEIIGRLLVPDNNVIQQATQELRELVKSPEVVTALCTVLTTSPQAQVRQYAAVLLRRKITKKRHWNVLPTNIQQSITENVLQVLLHEPEKPVRKSLAQLVGTVARHQLPLNQWPQLLTFLQEYCLSEDVSQREIGMYVLSVVTETADVQLQPHINAVLSLCGQVLDDQASVDAPYYSIVTLTHMVSMAGSEEEKLLQSLLPKMINVIQKMVLVDEDKACEALEIFDELLEIDIPVVAPFVKDIIEFSLGIGANVNIGDSVRIKALSFVSCLARSKKKAIVKLKLVPAILGVLFPIMCETAADDDDEYFGDAETNTASAFAGQVIDAMALNLPPEKMIPELMKLVEPHIQSTVPDERKAAFWAIAVCAEGCADHMRTKHLKSLLQCVCKGMSDDQSIVRNAAFFALGQFSEYLQPDISKYSSELLPLLFEHVGRVTENRDNDPKSVSKTYYALETFCENLGKDLLPYLPSLMEHLLVSLYSDSTSLRIKELAISAIAATANAAKEELLPFFPKIIEQLKQYLNFTEDEDQLKLQIQAIDTLGVLARTLGIEAFAPLATECIEHGLKLVANSKDPDLRRCIYGMFAAVSTILKESMEPYLEMIVGGLLDAVNSTEGVTPHYSDEASELLQIFSMDNDEDEENIEASSEEEEEDDREVKDVTIENAYFDEKEEACLALGEICFNSGLPFVKYTETVYDQLYTLYDHPITEIRKNVLIAIGQFCCGTHKVIEATGSEEAKSALHAMLETTVVQLLKIINDDDERHVVMAAFEVLAEMLSTIKEPILHARHGGDSEAQFNAIVEVVMAAFQKKLSCQEFAEDEGDDDKQEAEYDTMVIENAGDVIPALAKIVSPEAFIPVFVTVLPEFLKRMKRTSTVAEKSFAVGAIAETLNACGPAAAAFAQTLYPMFMALVKDEDEEVRNNVVFAIGVMASNGGEDMILNYPHILKELFTMLNDEKTPLVLDNICGAVCRMMMRKTEAVPLDKVFPVVIRCLPLKEDMEENETVYTCIAKLYQEHTAVIIQYLPQLLTIFAQVLGSKDIKQDIQLLIVQLVQDVQTKFPTEFQSGVTSLQPAEASKLSTSLTMLNT